MLLIFHPDTDKSLSINNLPPLGVLYIASYLEKHGVQVDVIDTFVTPLKIDTLEPYELIGFSVNISNKKCSFEAITEIKKSYPDKSIIVGGPLCMSSPELFFDNPDIDAVFDCEGEEAVLEYITSENKENIKGVYVRKGTDFVYSGSRNWIENLDELPFPALDKLKPYLKKYRNVPRKKKPISTMFTSRGCPFGCIFCSHAMGRKWRSRSADNVVDEIKWQVNELGVKEICIYDDNFSLNKARVEAICQRLIEEKVKVAIQFTNGLRVDSLDYESLRKLRKAGAWMIGIAPETGNPEVMKKIKKSMDHQQMQEIREYCKKLGIKTFGFFMIGFPFETKENILETIDYAKALDTEIVEFNKVIPYSKTELFDMMVEDGSLLADSVFDAQSYHDGTITTHKVGDLSPDELKTLIKRAYRQYYLRPKKMIDLLKTFSIKNLFELTIYALRTRNI